MAWEPPTWTGAHANSNFQAFTPTCTVNHLPPYVEKYAEFKAKGAFASSFSVP